ncbi:Zinc finger protein 367 [Lepeophtheirus salmonis]|uniref:Zinc finger protein 367 n=1 Tax=Lepeophtheirus salmonis TaxID=72036 RepID=A0A7R8D067_LEPSM|nr:Zinc finger protein 367 [Lepeophtheirus salmonis]CAF2940865.1 Zinc finger protein 367 [Lepeophtheirus salmonis]
MFYTLLPKTGIKDIFFTNRSVILNSSAWIQGNLHTSFDTLKATLKHLHIRGNGNLIKSLQVEEIKSHPHSTIKLHSRTNGVRLWSRGTLHANAPGGNITFKSHGVIQLSSKKYVQLNGSVAFPSIKKLSRGILPKSPINYVFAVMGNCTPSLRGSVVFTEIDTATPIKKTTLSLQLSTLSPGSPVWSNNPSVTSIWSEKVLDLACPSTPDRSGNSGLNGNNNNPNNTGDSGKRGRPRADVISHLILEGSSSPSGIKCRVCSRVFPREKSLQAHLRTHTGERPYNCDYPGCNRAFTQSGQLKTHQRLHAGEKPFICSSPGCMNRYTHANRTCPIHPYHKPQRSSDLVLQPVLSGSENKKTPGKNISVESPHTIPPPVIKTEVVEDEFKRATKRGLELDIENSPLCFVINKTPKKSSASILEERLVSPRKTLGDITKQSSMNIIGSPLSSKPSYITPSSGSFKLKKRWLKEAFLEEERKCHSSSTTEATEDLALPIRWTSEDEQQRRSPKSMVVAKALLCLTCLLPLNRNSPTRSLSLFIHPSMTTSTCQELRQQSDEEIAAFINSFDTVLTDCDGVLCTKHRRDFLKKCIDLKFGGTQDEVLGTAYLAAWYLKKLDDVGIEHIGLGPDLPPKEPFSAHVAVDIVKELDPDVNCKNPALYFLLLIRMKDSQFTVPAERDPVILGKPNTFFFEAVRQRCPNVEPQRTLMIGDRANTDILLGKNCNLKTLQVGGGVHKLSDIRRWEKSACPKENRLVADYYLDSLGDLLPLMQRVRHLLK